jgi:glucose-6-phosphate 1-dehydrogenase
VGEFFEECQVYRIDHYLGKETVLNLLALRFANSLFVNNWDSRTIDHVEITVAEEVGIEGRWGYFDQAGQMRDMIQNHLLQILCMIAMSPPSDLTADSIRDEKVKVLKSLRRIDRTNVREKRCAASTPPALPRAKSAGLPRRRGGQQVQPYRNLRGDPRGYRQLALGGRTVLPAYR